MNSSEGVPVNPDVQTGLDKLSIEAREVVKEWLLTKLEGVAREANEISETRPDHIRDDMDAVRNYALRTTKVFAKHEILENLLDDL